MSALEAFGIPDFPVFCVKMPEKAFRHYIISTAHVAEVILVIGSRFKAVFVSVCGFLVSEFERIVTVNLMLVTGNADVSNALMNLSSPQTVKDFMSTSGSFRFPLHPENAETVMMNAVKSAKSLRIGRLPSLRIRAHYIRKNIDNQFYCQRNISVIYFQGV